ncbi:MAG: hypothetical protein CVU44_15170 [Chloroflexi bacterium HGW-Chloroflexi-6]|nr:MAG: hypothetical protein CVU44_15170 [Chloroflexi bacterium HGW-Chloroflexi-6]
MGTDGWEPRDWAIVYAIGFGLGIACFQVLSGSTCSGVLTLFASAGCVAIQPRRAMLIWFIISLSVPVLYAIDWIFNLPIAPPENWFATLLMPPVLALIGMFAGAGYGTMNEIARDY